MTAAPASSLVHPADDQGAAPGGRPGVPAMGCAPTAVPHSQASVPSRARGWATLAAVCAALCMATPAAWADKAAAIDEMEAYLEFVDYGGGVMFAQQIPKADWPRFMVIDARDAAQYAKEHIPGAVNMDWRQVLAKRNTIPKDKPVLLYCNTGTLSAQAAFALRVAGWDNVRVLQGGLVEWKASGGFDAATQATGAATH